MQAAADAADKAAVAQKVEVDAEVERRLKIALAAQHEVAVEETEKTEAVNEVSSNGRISDEEIAKRDAKRQAGLDKMRANAQPAEAVA